MRSRGIVFLTAVLALTVLLGGVTTAAYRLGQQSLLSADPSAGRLSVVAEVYHDLVRDAVGAPEGDVLLQGAIEGMIATLEDPYAAYFDAAAFADFNRQLDGSFTGIGLMLEDTPEGPKVVSVLPGTPAEQGGVEVGERIVSVDGQDVSDLPIELIVRRVTGEEGTTVTVGFAGGSQGPREIEFTRARIDLPVVETELLEDNIGHIRLLSFPKGAGAKVAAAVEELLAEGAEGILLDLRGNPGGLLDAAVDVASVFVDEGEIVTVREADGRERTLRARPGGFADLPLVVLVDGSSASASEILAGAMQDLGRAPVVGAKTFGKGTVQTVRSLSDRSGLKFTTAEYVTPSGDSIEGVGVAPDTEVADPEAQLAAAREALRSVIVLDPAA